jgi:CRISPR-associated protein Csm2
MNQPSRPFKPNQAAPQSSTSTSTEDEDIVTLMTKKISQFKNGLKEYKTRELVEDTEKLGRKLAQEQDPKLKTTQIRKFLDAINRLKVKTSGLTDLPEDVKSELHLLRPKLAYAAARQATDRNPGPVEPLKKVLEAALKKDMDMEDFFRLVQLIEAIIAYHKAAGGKDQ